MESLNKYQQTPNLIEKWEKLQTLLKLEVTLMNLSKTHINTSIETINRNIIEYYRKKIQTKEAYDYNNQNLYLTKNQKSWSLPKYSLIENTGSVLENYYSLLENFFFSLRNDTKAMITLIQKITPDQFEDMIILLSTFFFENPFNTSFDQEPLLEIICQLVKEEINSLTSVTVTSFLDSNFIGSLLKSLSRRPDIKSYLAKVLGDVILDMENMSQQFLSLDISRIAEWVTNSNKIINDITSLKNVNNITKNYPRMRGGSILNKKLKFIPSSCSVYIYDNLTHSKLVENEKRKVAANGENAIEANSADIKQSSELLLPPEIIDVDNYLQHRNPVYNPEYGIDISEEGLEYKKNNEDCTDFMKEFYEKQIRTMKREQITYCHIDNILNELANVKDDWKSILFEFKKNFEKFKFFIDKLLINLLENESIVPYSIKVICKAIDIFLEKKFPNISTVDKNAFISEFFVGKLIIPILTNPDYNGIISSSIISPNTRKNMMYLTKIIKKLFRGTFFNSQFEKSFTIFNIYFCEIMPKVNEFIEKIQEVKFSPELEKTIGVSNTPNGMIETTIGYKEKQSDRIFTHNSVVFKYNDFINLYNTFKQNEALFLNQHKDNLSLINSYKAIKENENDIIKILLKDTTEIKYYLLSKNDFNYSMIDDMTLKKKRFSFNNSSTFSKDNKEEVILSRVKYCIKTILRNLNFINLSYELHSSKFEVNNRFL